MRTKVRTTTATLKFLNVKLCLRRLFWIKRFTVEAENRSTELTTKSSAPTRLKFLNINTLGPKGRKHIARGEAPG